MKIHVDHKCLDLSKSLKAMKEEPKVEKKIETKEKEEQEEQEEDK